MEFVVGDMAITTIGLDGDDRAIEFLVFGPAATDQGRFAIHREHGQGWETARLTVPPQAGSVPVAAVEWAVEFAREYL
ncbi:MULTISPECIES: hypothetical protein [Streptomyces]|uniref:Uncharacterized protein n=1 Tax=Streptomyces subrutilus TaxID=36818 RepID=A0A1E5PVD8_9ACTN|nr:hypothetical protein [Streptomyces subrutilus]OEJ33481.1 hypothetical protein BGK67_21010 [Streptomyces subrutilus]